VPELDGCVFRLCLSLCYAKVGSRITGRCAWKRQNQVRIGNGSVKIERLVLLFVRRS
jgi:hypothetical protein